MSDVRLLLRRLTSIGCRNAIAAREAIIAEQTTEMERLRDQNRDNVNAWGRSIRREAQATARSAALEAALREARQVMRLVPESAFSPSSQFAACLRLIDATLAPKDR